MGGTNGSGTTIISGSGGFYSTFYVLTNDGYAYKVNNHGINGASWSFFANNKGIVSGGTQLPGTNGFTGGEPTYQSQNSIGSTTQNTHDPRFLDATNDFTHKVFYSKPASDLPASATAIYRRKDGSNTITTTWLKTSALNPEVSDVSIKGVEANTDWVVGPDGAYISFTSNVYGSYVIDIDLNGNGQFDDPADRRWTGSAVIGTNTVTWDGKDGLGNLITIGTTEVTVRAQVNLGEVHFPFVDGEINPNGVIFERLDESYNVIPGQDLLYWDDSNITITEGCDPNRYTASNPLKNVYTGLSSNSNGHKWGSTVTSAPFEGGCGSAQDVNDSNGKQDFGNGRILDSWTYVGGAQQITRDIFSKYLDLAVSAPDPSPIAVCENGTVTYSVNVTNASGTNGSDAAEGAKFRFDAPAGLTIVSRTVTVNFGTFAETFSSGLGTSQYNAVFNQSNPGSVTYSFTCVVTGTITNPTAYVMRPPDVFDTDATSSVSGAPADYQVECDGGTSGTGCNNIRTATTSVIILSSGVDTDNDGIDDICDLDDDNDGILDIDEALCLPDGTAFSINSTRVPTPYALNTALQGGSTGTANLTGFAYGTFNFTASVSGTATWGDGVQIQNNVTVGDHIYLQPQNAPGGGAANFATYTIDFPYPVLDFSFVSAGLNYNDFYEITAFYNNTPITVNSSNFSGFNPDLASGSWTINGSRISNSSTAGGTDVTENVFTTSFSGPVDKVVIKSGKIDGLTNTITTAITSMEFCSLSRDTDKDGIFDHLDNDSDNDGCPDAIEGAGSYTAADLDDNNRLDYANLSPSGVDGDGVVNAGSQATAPAVITSDVLTVPVITQNPSPVCAGETITFTATTSGVRVTNFGTTGSTDDDTTIPIPTGDIIYKWYLGTTLITDGGIYSGAGTSALTISGVTEAMSGNSYSVEVSTLNNICSEVQSTLLNVTPLPGATVSHVDATCYEENGSITFSFPDYPAQTSISFSIDNGITYTTVDDNSGTYTFPNLDAATYHAWVRWGNGSCAVYLGNVTIADTPDDENPSITCPQSVLLPNHTGSCSITYTPENPDVSDNCTVSPTLTWVMTGKTTGSGSGYVGEQTFNSGETWIIYTVTDGIGNTATCGFTVTVDPCADLVTVKSLSSATSTPNEGDVVQFTITVTNNGPDEAAAVSLTDLLPAGITLTGYSVSPTHSVYNTGTGVWNGFSLLPGASATLVLTGKVDVGQGGNTITNYTTKAESAEHDPTDEGNDLEETINVNNNPSIDLIKEGTWNDANSDGIAQAGETISYTFTVTNTGDVTLYNVTVTDPLLVTPNGSITGGPIASLAPGATNSSTIKGIYTLTQADIDAGVFSNTATVTAKDPQDNDVTDTGENTEPLPQSPSIALVKTGDYQGDPTAAKVGDKIIYTFVVTNTGNVTVSDLVIDDEKLGLIGLAVVPGTLAPAGTGTASFTYAITQADIDAGHVLNTALATGEDPDGGTVTDISGTAVDNDTPTIIILCPLIQTWMAELKECAVTTDGNPKAYFALKDADGRVSTSYYDHEVPEGVTVTYYDSYTHAQDATEPLDKESYLSTTANVWARVANGDCYGIDIVELVVYTPGTINLSATDVSCSGKDDGALTINMQGAPYPFTIHWIAGGLTDVTIENAYTHTWPNLGPGTYTAIITDGNGCSLERSVTLTEPPVLQASVSSTGDVSCYGGNDGTATVMVSGGTPPYQILWSNGSTNALATGLIAGTYDVTVTDARGCEATAEVSLTEPLPLLVTAEVTSDASCNEDHGEATAMAEGGTAPYTYIWSNGFQETTYGSSTITGLVAGAYQVTVRDANGCEVVDGVMIRDLGGLTAIVDMHRDVSCYGGSDGAISITVSGGTGPGTYIYDWDSSNGFASTGEDIMDIPAGLYKVVIYDGNGCMAVLKNIEITQPDQLVVEETDNQPVSCYGESDGSAAVAAAGGTAPYTYDWLDRGGADDEAWQSGLAAGNYTILVTDANGCEEIINVIITQPALLTAEASVPADGHVSCFGGNDGEATVTVTGGTEPYTYEWSNGSSDQTATGLTFGSYQVVVKDANGCMVTSNWVDILQPESAVQVVITATTNPSCEGNINGSATAEASGGIPPYTYLWSNGQTGATATGLTAGTYLVTATDANGCEETTAVVLNDPNGLTAVFTSWKDVTCNGGNDGRATLVVNGGKSPYDFVWSNGFVQNDVSGPNATSIATGLTAGLITVQVTDAGGCQVVAVIEIEQPAPVGGTPVVVHPVSCYGGNDGSALVVASGGTAPYTYLWSNGQNTFMADHLTAGNHTVTITDYNRCTATVYVTVPGPQTPLAVTASGIDVKCFGTSTGMATVTSVTGGTPPYSYSWNTTPVQTSATAVNLAAGIYTVTVTDKNNCSTTATAVVSQPATPVTLGTPVVTDADCSGNQTGGVQLFASGGTGTLNYKLSTGLTNTTGIFTNLVAGVYTYTVTDMNGCSATGGFQITDPVSLVLTVKAVVNPSCWGEATGGASVEASGGSGEYSFAWKDALGFIIPSSSFLNSSSVTNLKAGIYTAMVVDTKGCSAVQTVTITQPAQLSAVITSFEGVSCQGAADGTATVDVSGGTAPYRYAWNTVPVQTAPTATGLAAGIYTVNITDANNCTTSVSVNIPAGKIMTIDPLADLGTYCPESEIPAILLSAQPANASTVFTWTVSGDDIGLSNGLSTGINPNIPSFTASEVPGTAKITVTATLGACFDTEVFTITVGDDVSPVLRGVPADLTVSCDAVPPAGTGVYATDNCDSDPDVVFSEQRVDGSCEFSYTLLRTWTATDGAGNSTAVTQTILVEDNEVPVVVSCPQDISVDNDPGGCGAVVTYTVPLFEDNCGGTAEGMLTEGLVSGEIFPPGTTKVTYSYTDACGNGPVTCTFTVTVAPCGGLTISGNVFHDLDKLENGKVDGIGTNAGGLYANLVNPATDAVISSVEVNADGTWLISQGVEENSSYVIILSNTLKNIGVRLTTATLPAGWSSSGENLGAGAGSDGTVDGKLAVTTGTTDVTEANFGIFQVPDVTPIITAVPNVMHGQTKFYVTVRVTELNMVNTNGQIIVRIPKDTRWALDGPFSTSMTVIGSSTSVHNSVWTYSQNATHHIFTTFSVIEAGSFSRFGFYANWNGGETWGVYTITSQIDSWSGGENRIDNNVDAEKLDYFIY